MYGFVGGWNVGRFDTLRDALRPMTDRLQRRGPDSAEFWLDAERGIALGRQRLATIAGAAPSHQAMCSTTGRFVMVYTGEVYNHADLRRDLAAADSAPVWHGHLGTETLLACFEAWGVEATLQRSVGKFAFAVWDRQERCLLLARDRAGEKPLYYGWQGGTFLFGSELKALREYPTFNATIDRGVLALFLRHNYIPAPYSIHPDIYKLPPGTWLCLHSGQRDVKPKNYWSITEIALRGAQDPFKGNETEAVDELGRLLGKSVAGQQIADVPVGTLLSGGVDSSLIAALVQAQSGTPIRTFTIGFDESTYNESHHARAVARYLGTQHTEMQLSANDALNMIPRLSSMYDEPFADSSQLPTHLVMSLAQKHVSIALSGDAGDEFFGGYQRYFEAPNLWGRISRVPQPCRNVLSDAIQRVPPRLINVLMKYIARRIGVHLPGDKLHKLARRMKNTRNIDEFYAALISEWSDAAAIVVGAEIPPNILDDPSRWPPLGDPVARMMALDGMTYLPDDILVKVDRAAMAASFETRAPFLDRDVMEFAWSLPMDMKIRGGRGKWILRQLLDRHVPRELIERPKQGFGIPFNDWLRGPLREWAGDLLTEERLTREGYFDSKVILQTWNAHCRGEVNLGSRLWSVLMFQAWRDTESPRVS